jgi:hypothetical protein
MEHLSTNIGDVGDGTSWIIFTITQEVIPPNFSKILGNVLLSLPFNATSIATLADKIIFKDLVICYLVIYYNRKNTRFTRLCITSKYLPDSIFTFWQINPSSAVTLDWDLRSISLI